MDKPYLKKWDEIAPVTVWIVDGKYIRSNINQEFVNFGYHRLFAFIPENELWIDREYGEGGGNKLLYGEFFGGKEIFGRRIKS